MNLLYVFIAFIVGALVPFQSAINSQLGNKLSSPYQAAFVNFLVGLILIFLCLVLTPLGLPEWKRVVAQPPTLLLGGVFGAIFVFSGIFFLPKIGALAFVTWMVAGQLFVSLVLDHFGLMGVAQQPLNLARVLGVGFLLAGMFLVIKR
jgi:transporter family-2 protein